MKWWEIQIIGMSCSGVEARHPVAYERDLDCVKVVTTKVELGKKKLEVQCCSVCVLRCRLGSVT